MQTQVKSQTLDPIFFPRLNHLKKSYLAARPPLLCGLTRRRAGHEEQKLAAASSACGPCEMGAATGPLDGRALTHGVDARRRGAGSSAATLHRSTMGVHPLWFLRFKAVLVERKG
jgi:hypothetical protein